MINAPVMVLLLIGAFFVLPESRNPSPGPFDVLSAALSIVGILPLVYGLKVIGTEGVSLPPVTALLVGAGLLALFVLRQRRLVEPLLDVTLFANRTFTVAVLTNLLATFALVGVLFFLPQYLQIVLGLSPLTAGLWMMPLAIGTISGSLAAPSLSRLVGLRVIVGGGMLLASVGFAAGAMLASTGSLGVLLTWTALVGLGVGMAESLTNDVIVASAPPERTGGAAAISETAYEFGAAMGTAVLGTVGLLVYRAGLDGAPLSVSEQAVEAGGETLGALSSAAVGLPADVASAFTAVANTAFTSGLATVLGVAALVTAYTGVQALVVLRDPRTAAALAARQPHQPDNQHPGPGHETLMLVSESGAPAIR